MIFIMICRHFFFFLVIFHWLFFLLGTSSIREGNGNPLQYSCLVNPTEKGAWWATAHGVGKSRTQLSDSHTHTHTHTHTQFYQREKRASKGKMASPMHRTWTWANFRKRWGTGRSGYSPWGRKESDTAGRLDKNSSLQYSKACSLTPSEGCVSWPSS